jgi:hypothetical protein
VFDNRTLRRLLGPKKHEVIGGWRKLHNEKLHNLYLPPSIIKMMKTRWMKRAGHVTLMEENFLQNFGRKYERRNQDED